MRQRFAQRQVGSLARSLVRLLLAVFLIIILVIISVMLTAPQGHIRALRNNLCLDGQRQGSVQLSHCGTVNISPHDIAAQRKTVILADFRVFISLLVPINQGSSWTFLEL